MRKVEDQKNFIYGYLDGDPGDDGDDGHGSKLPDCLRAG